MMNGGQYGLDMEIKVYGAVGTAPASHIFQKFLWLDTVLMRTKQISVHCHIVPKHDDTLFNIRIQSIPLEKLLDMRQEYPI